MSQMTGRNVVLDKIREIKENFVKLTKSAANCTEMDQEELKDKIKAEGTHLKECLNQLWINLEKLNREANGSKKTKEKQEKTPIPKEYEDDQMANFETRFKEVKKSLEDILDRKN